MKGSSRDEGTYRQPSPRYDRLPRPYRASVPMRPGGDSVERIRRHEVSRALKKVNVSSEEAGIIDLLSRLLVGKLLDGPISEVLARAESEISFKYRPSPETSYGLESHGNGVEVSGAGDPQQYPREWDALHR
jgi:Glutamyl-tRNAGlu reductase, dimerisation domain